MIRFDFSCKYDLVSDDQHDINKLFGIGYLWRQHKQDSARYGWHYDKLREKFILSAYCYVQGSRQVVYICEVVATKRYLLELKVLNGEYEFSVFHDDGYLISRQSVPFYHKKNWSYALGPFFGGNRPAPHNMNFEMKDV